MRAAKSVLVIMGSVIGAGFISGRELLRFFGQKNFIPTAFISATVFFLLIYFLLNMGFCYGGFNGALRAFPRAASIIFKGLLYVSLFIIISGMLAGINSIFPNASPVPSIISAAACVIICIKGIGGLTAANIIAVPCILIFLAVAIPFGGNISYATGEVELIRPLSAVIYAGLNIFLAAPVICDLGKDMKRSKGVTAFASALLLFIFICLILSAVCDSEKAESFSFPLLYALKKFPFFKAVCVFGAFTTLISAYYPLYSLFNRAKKPVAIAARAVILIAAGALSKIGFNDIVEKIYPIMAAAGFASLLLAAVWEGFRLNTFPILLPISATPRDKSFIQGNDD